MRKLLFFVLLFFVFIGRILAQSGYPIYVTPTLTPPYTLKLSDYSSFGSQRLVVNITVNDLNISNLPVKLHIKMETVGVTVETPVTINTTPIYLDGGAVTLVFGDDLTDYFNIDNLIFKGYSKESYKRTGQLPEGFYRITVEVLHYQTNRLISNSGTATAWITLGSPPILKFPENNKVMDGLIGMPLTFSWMPCNLGNPASVSGVQYKFEMWEMRVDGVSPYIVALTVPVFYEETTQNTLLSVYPSAMLMEPGMKYAWRVTASDLSGYVPFKEDGHSEIRVFTYKSKCDSVTNFKAKATGQNAIFSWQANSNHTSYNVELKNPSTGWLSASETFDSRAEFYDLDYGSAYEARVQAVCDNDPNSVSDFSEWQRVEISEQRSEPDSSACPNCGCDNNIPDITIENLELKKDLKPGDTLINRSGTTRFIVKTVTPQGDGVYKGVFLFWAEIWQLKFVCEYWDLSANTDNVILNMDYQSVYNPQFLLDVDLAAAYLDSLMGAITDLTVNTSITDTLTVNGDITTIYTNGGDSLVIVTVGENGDTTEVVITNPEDIGHTLITGGDGEEYVVTGDGEVMGVDEFKETGGNDRKIEEYKEEKESHLSSTTVEFSASPNQQYGFDAFSENKQSLSSNYPALANGYTPPYKSVASYETDKVVPSTFEKGITFRDEMGIPAVTVGDELSVRGGTDGSVVSLYAYKAVNDTVEEVAGKLNVMSFDQQVKRLYIVQVNNAKMPDSIALQNVLNTVYAQAVTRWEVTKIDPGIDVTFANGQMTHGGSGAISVYNDDQKAIIDKFSEDHSIESDAMYLFFVDNVVGKTGDIAGYMPLQRQIGFIYDNPNLFVIAHELGHGAFNLRHTFSPENFIAAEHTTQNLMDYNGGVELWKHQWEQIRDPESLWFAWAQDESEGEMENSSSGNSVFVTKSTTNTAYGLDILSGSTDEYVSIINAGTTELEIEVNPQGNYWITSSDSLKLRIDVPVNKKISSQNNSIKLSSSSTSLKDMVKLQIRRDSINGTIEKEIEVKLYNEKLTDFQFYYVDDPSSSSANVTTKFTSASLLPIAKDILKQAVVDVGSFTVNTLQVSYDINNNGALDIYVGSSNDPELNAITTNATLSGNNDALVCINEIRKSYRITDTAKVGDDFIIVEGLDSKITNGRVLTLENSTTLNTESVVVDRTVGLRIYFQDTLRNNYIPTDVAFRNITGLSATPQLVVTGTLSEVIQTIVHERLHKSPFGLKDLLNQDNIMYKTRGRSDTKLRYRQEQKSFETGTESQWDKITR